MYKTSTHSAAPKCIGTKHQNKSIKYANVNCTAHLHLETTRTYCNVRFVQLRSAHQHPAHTVFNSYNTLQYTLQGTNNKCTYTQQDPHHRHVSVSDLYWPPGGQVHCLYIQTDILIDYINQNTHPPTCVERKVWAGQPTLTITRVADSLARILYKLIIQIDQQSTLFLLLSKPTFPLSGQCGDFVQYSKLKKCAQTIINFFVFCF